MLHNAKYYFSVPGHMLPSSWSKIFTFQPLKSMYTFTDVSTFTDMFHKSDYTHIQILNTRLQIPVHIKTSQCAFIDTYKHIH